jgi:ribonuclease HI
MSTNSKVEIYTDGACEGNPGRGGWACVLRFGPHQKELFGHAEKTTNQRMELAAAACGLASLTRPAEVLVFSDSKYLVDGMSAGWLDRWQKTGWMNSGKQPVKNRDLWQLILKNQAIHKVEWVWVKGHAEDPANNQADALAWIAARSMSEEKCVHVFPEVLASSDCMDCAEALKRFIPEQGSFGL